MTTTPSFIAIVDFSTAAADRSAAIAQLEREQPVVSAMPGCLALRVFADRRDDTGITVVHEWVDEQSLTGTSAPKPSHSRESSCGR
jgi:quinol monooxygenase YgiN